MPVEPNLEAINPSPTRSGLSQNPQVEPRAVAYDPTQDRETIRGSIATWLVWTLIVVIATAVLTGLVTAIGCSQSGTCSNDIVEMKSARVVIELVLTPLVGLVGAVTGFYYGEKSGASK